MSTLDYNREEDAYYCPKGQQMGCIGQHKERSSTGYASTVKRYEGQNGSSCPLRGVCHKSKGKRVVKVNELLNGYKKAFREGLSTQEGIELYKRRGREVETVFGVVKQHMGFRRFYLRRKEKVELEVGLLWLSYTLKQWAKSIQKRTQEGLRTAA